MRDKTIIAVPIVVILLALVVYGVTGSSTDEQLEEAQVSQEVEQSAETAESTSEQPEETDAPNEDVQGVQTEAVSQPQTAPQNSTNSSSSAPSDSNPAPATEQPEEAPVTRGDTDQNVIDVVDIDPPTPTVDDDIDVIDVPTRGGGTLTQ